MKRMRVFVLVAAVVVAVVPLCGCGGYWYDYDDPYNNYRAAPPVLPPIQEYWMRKQTEIMQEMARQEQRDRYGW